MVGFGSRFNHAGERLSRHHFSHRDAPGRLVRDPADTERIITLFIQPAEDNPVHSS